MRDGRHVGDMGRMWYLILCCCWLQVVVAKIGTDGCFDVYPYQSMQSRQGQVVTSNDVETCEERCLHETSFLCLSFDYHRHNSTCVLQEDSALITPENLVPNQESDHYERLLDCRHRHTVVVRKRNRTNIDPISHPKLDPPEPSKGIHIPRNDDVPVGADAEVSSLKSYDEDNADPPRVITLGRRRNTTLFVKSGEEQGRRIGGGRGQVTPTPPADDSENSLHVPDVKLSTEELRQRAEQSLMRLQGGNGALYFDGEVVNLVRKPGEDEPNKEELGTMTSSEENTQDKLSVVDLPSREGKRTRMSMRERYKQNTEQHAQEPPSEVINANRKSTSAKVIHSERSHDEIKETQRIVNSANVGSVQSRHDVTHENLPVAKLTYRGSSLHGDVHTDDEPDRRSVHDAEHLDHIEVSHEKFKKMGSDDHDHSVVEPFRRPVGMESHRSHEETVQSHQDLIQQHVAKHEIQLGETSMSSEHLTTDHSDEHKKTKDVVQEHLNSHFRTGPAKQVHEHDDDENQGDRHGKRRGRPALQHEDEEGSYTHDKHRKPSSHPDTHSDETSSRVDRRRPQSQHIHEDANLHNIQKRHAKQTHEVDHENQRVFRQAAVKHNSLHEADNVEHSNARMSPSYRSDLRSRAEKRELEQHHEIHHGEISRHTHSESATDVQKRHVEGHIQSRSTRQHPIHHDDHQSLDRPSRAMHDVHGDTHERAAVSASETHRLSHLASRDITSHGTQGHSRRTHDIDHERQAYMDTIHADERRITSIDKKRDLRRQHRDDNLLGSLERKDRTVLDTTSKENNSQSPDDDDLVRLRSEEGNLLDEFLREMDRDLSDSLRSEDGSPPAAVDEEDEGSASGEWQWGPRDVFVEDDKKSKINLIDEAVWDMHSD